MVSYPYAVLFLIFSPLAGMLLVRAWFQPAGRGVHDIGAVRGGPPELETALLEGGSALRVGEEGTRSRQARPEFAIETGPALRMSRF